MEKIEATGRIFENTWTCPYCGKRNRGRDKNCAGCGCPKGQETEYDHNHISVLEGRDAEEYMAGPDWLCECCGSYNSAKSNSCRSCGAPKGAAKNYFEVKREQEEKRATRYEEEHHVTTVKPSAPLWQNLLIGAGMAVLIGLCIWFLVWVITPEKKTGIVTDLTWYTSATLEELTTIHEEGWDPPAGATILGTERKFKETVPEIDHYDPVTVPVTKYRTVQDPDLVWYTYEDMGNGFDQEVKHTLPQSHQEPYTDYEVQHVPVYKDVDVYDDWYIYEYDDWIVIDEKAAQGSKGTEHEPELEMENDRQNKRFSNVYRVYIKTEEEDVDFVISKDLYEWMEVDDSVTFENGKFGFYEILEINGNPVNGEGNGE